MTAFSGWPLTSGWAKAPEFSFLVRRAGLMPTAEFKRTRHEENPDAFPFGDWYSGDNANIAIGQGDIAVTPLQLANSYATLANGGTLRAPNIVHQIRPPDGGEVIDFGPRVVREAEIPEPISQVILDGLIGVTHQPKVQLDRPGGTAFTAFNEPENGGVDFDSVQLAGRRKDRDGRNCRQSRQFDICRIRAERLGVLE